ncbi:MAG: PPC domain-containing protein [Puniceicoccaceae bacterium]
MKHFRFLLTAAAVLLLAANWLSSQPATSARLGYVYPAGGQAGTTFTVTAGGKGLRGVKSILISGDGVSAEFVEHVTNYQQRLQEHMRTVGRQRQGRSILNNQGEDTRRFGDPPDHPIFNSLEEVSNEEFRILTEKFQKKERIQRNREIGELAVLKVTIAPNAKPGMRELRLVTNLGASNPVRFMVNTLPEVRESEPNDQQSRGIIQRSHPFVINGQVMPGDEDKFKFLAEEGDKLIIHAKARALVPYLADAVPGWFQAVISLKDESGTEVAYADDFRFDPDPVLYYEVQNTGTFELTIRDSIYRGREDFVYRISVGELPFITGIYPLGGQAGSPTTVAVDGWNLPEDMVELYTDKKGRSIRTANIQYGRYISNDIQFAVSANREYFESDSNDTRGGAQRVKLPATLNGKIDTVGDYDFYSFWAKQGDSVKVEVLARQLNSPVDSLIRVFNKKGEVLALNDDREPTGEITDRKGLLTHYSDSSLAVFIPEDGIYFVQVSDTQNKGGPEYAYRLSIGKMRPDFDLYVTPSGITGGPGATCKVTAHIERKNGFEGPVRIGMANAPKGYFLTGNTIPANCNSVSMVLKVPWNEKSKLRNLNFIGKAKFNGKDLVKIGVPADDITQAFITHHLVESEHTCLTLHNRGRSVPPIQVKHRGPVELSPGLTKGINLDVAPNNKVRGELKLELVEGPEGITLESSRRPSGLRLELTGNEKLESGMSGNLIVGIFAEYPQRDKDGKETGKRKVHLGYIPAIPYKTL